MRADLHLYTMYKFGPIGIELCRHDRVTFTEGFPALGGGRRGVRTRDTRPNAIRRVAPVEYPLRP